MQPSGPGFSKKNPSEFHLLPQECAEHSDCPGSAVYEKESLDFLVAKLKNRRAKNKTYGKTS
jgi:hypothetical protein